MTSIGIVDGQKSAKLAIAGLHSLRYLRDHGIINPTMRPKYFVSYIASYFGPCVLVREKATGKME